MKALTMSMSSTAKKATQNRVRDMRVLRGGIGSNLLREHQIKDIIRRKNEEKELRKWQKFGESSTTKNVIRSLRKKRKNKASN